MGNSVQAWWQFDRKVYLANVRRIILSSFSPSPSYLPSFLLSLFLSFLELKNLKRQSVKKWRRSGLLTLTRDSQSTRRTGRTFSQESLITNSAFFRQHQVFLHLTRPRGIPSQAMAPAGKNLRRGAEMACKSHPSLLL